ncbi:unnamed protein product [Adineta steineri]|uniref:Uncharacterized protein n=1 Tax=Adineta steineri TaxID=433720 RepID=A0A815FVP2_9BILA|nr:unnamed protein product [Adineta steineri]
MSALQSWEEKARQKRTALHDLIPQEWKLSESIIKDPPKNLTIVPSQCGILSTLDLEIPEIDNIEELAQQIAQGKYSAIQVTQAYCKRAAIAHQLFPAISSFKCEHSHAS